MYVVYNVNVFLKNFIRRIYNYLYFICSKSGKSTVRQLLSVGFSLGKCSGKHEGEV